MNEQAIRSHPRNGLAQADRDELIKVKKLEDTKGPDWAGVVQLPQPCS